MIINNLTNKTPPTPFRALQRLYNYNHVLQSYITRHKINLLQQFYWLRRKTKIMIFKSLSLYLQVFSSRSMVQESYNGYADVYKMAPQDNRFFLY